MKLRKLSALLMAVVMLLGMLPAGHADGGNQLAGGVMTVSCNHKMSWVYPNGPAKDCRTEAVVEYKCSLCGYVERTQRQAGECVGSGKWTWDGKKPANCQEEGLLVENCKYCGRGVDERNARGDHNWKTESKKATCTEGGYTRTYCTACGDVKEDTTTKARGHNFDNFVLTREPTCVEYGRKRGECTRCDATIVYNVKTIPHTWTEWTVIQEATAEQEGIREKHCTMCGLTEQERFRVGEENESANEVKNAMTVEVVSALPVYPNVGDSFVVELLVTNTGDTILSYAGTALSNSDSDILGTPAAGGVDINMLNPGESFIVPVTVTVTDDDQALNYVERAFTVQMNVWANEKVGFMTPANKNTENDVSYPINVGLTGSASIAMLMQEEATETVDPNGLIVTLSDPDGSHMGYFYPGEEVPFSITVTNNTGVALTNVEITDPIKGSNEDAVVDRIISMQPGESVTVSFNYIATEADAAYGTECFENTAYATGYTADGTAINDTSNTVIVPCVIEHGLTFSKSVANTPANGEFFVPGETIVFEISMIDNTVYPIYCITLTDPLCEDQYIYDAINDMSYLYFGELYREDYAELDHSKSATVTVSYVVTEADAAAGSVTNTAEVWYQTWYGEEFTLSASATAPCGVGEPMNSAGVRLEKALRNAPANGEFYVPGEVLNYALTLRLDDGLLLDDAAIYDPIAGGDGLVISYGKGLYGGMGNDVFYVVTEEDAQRGYVENTAYATWIYQDSGEAGRVESNTVTALCGFDEPEFVAAPGLELTLTLVSTPANGTHFVIGEEVTFVESWVNNTSYTLDPFAVYTWTCHEPVYGSEIDQLSSCWFSDDGPVMPGATGSHSLTVIVTEADVARGSIYACAETSAAVQNGPDLENVLAPYVTAPCGPGELPAPNDDALNGVVVSKSVIDTPANGEYYVVGEGIKFQITVQNNLNQTVDTVVVTDPLAAEFYVETGEIPAGGMYDTSLIYYVTEFDAAVGSVTNYAFATVYVNRKPSAHTSNFVTVPVGYADGEAPFGTFSSIGVVKAEESLPLNGKFYTEGEVIHYTITYTNDGEQPLTDVEIWDSLNINAPIASAELLNPGESRVCYYQHTVTAADTVFGCVANMAIASYPIPGGAGYVSVNSNVVFSQTNERGYPDFYWFETLQPGEDSGYDPGSGFPGLDGAEAPFGTIDSGKLHGDAYCKRTIVSRDGTSVSYEWVYCPDHAAIQSSNLIMSQAATIPATKMQAAAYAVAMWRTEVEKIYKEMFEAADPVAKGVIMTEYVRFLSDAASYEVMLNLLYPDQPDVVAVKMAALWENKCMNLCYEAHAEPSARADSLTSILPVAGTGSDKCSCTTTAEENGKKAYTITYCPTHSFPFAMIDALLAGQDTADAWTIVRQIWMVELNKAYGTIASQLGDNGMVATAEFNMLTQWMMAREATLIALYPDNPELVMQMMTVLMMDRTNDLCQMYQ